MGFEMESDQFGGIESSSSSSHKHCGCGMNCICQVVRAIKDIQDSAEDDCAACNSNCFLEPLGNLALPTREHADTRVFTLTNKNGDLLKGLFKNKNTTQGACVSVYFRVEEVFDNCCATLRVLVPMKDRTTVADLTTNDGKINFNELCQVRSWLPSNSCITVDLHCFCAIQCIADCDLGLCD